MSLPNQAQPLNAFRTPAEGFPEIGRRLLPAAGLVNPGNFSIITRMGEALMVARLRQINRKLTPIRLYPAFVLVSLLWFAAGTPARACWNSVLLECFDRPPPQFPWQNPIGTGRAWRVCSVSGATHYCTPSIPQTMPRWGIQVQVFDNHNCVGDDRSAWCFGHPPDSDPRYDTYPANFDTYMLYGPINLSTAVAAAVSFYLFNESEELHDSVYWGASTTNILNNPANVNVGGSYWGNMLSGWEPRTMDLSRLRNLVSNDSVSMLGQSTVYAFWRFKSDGNAIRRRGAFVDNVQINWDDGGRDVAAGGLTIMYPDSQLMLQPFLGDTAWATFSVRTCAGGLHDYPEYRVIVRYDDQVVLDTMLVESVENETVTLTTRQWIFDSPGDHYVRGVADTMNQIVEVREDNNAATFSAWIEPPNPPPTFIWLSPGTDTLWADAVAVLRWFASDPDEEATLMFHSDVDQVGCQGVLLPNGQRLEDDGPDSLNWNTALLPNGRVYYPFVRVVDAANDICVYAPYPVVVRHETQSVRRQENAIPATHYLQQNYPNPFNPVTEIHYGIAQAGPVVLRVYDLLGRNVAIPVSDFHSSGSYVASFDGSDLPSGVYLYVLTTPEGTLSRKMVLMK